jgi:AAA+ superfamily predicted ATPase
MSYHPETSAIKRLIIDTYPQLVPAIEAVQWANWKSGDDIPNGKDIVYIGFYTLSVALSNVDGDFSIKEVEFFRDIMKEFGSDSDNVTTQQYLDLIQNQYDKRKDLYDLVLPHAVFFLDIYDKSYGTNLGQIARTMYFRYANAFVKADGRVADTEIAALEALQKLYYPEENISSENITVSSLKNNQDNTKLRSLDELINELNGLIGLPEVKRDVQELVNFLKIQQLREAKGMPTTPISKHLVFYGNPGTGKTTIARLLADIYKSLNVLSKGHLIETDRAGLVAGFVGQTALKVHEVVSKALGGILFIDEAYTLNGDGQDFGAEAIDTLLKLMEDNRNDLIVIVAGYTGKMAKFLASNPGLKSRFNKFLSFEDYSPEQLQEIFIRFCEKENFKLTSESKDKALRIFKILCEVKDETFGNARLARNIFEICVKNQANRIIQMNEITEEILLTIESVDIPGELEINSSIS